MTGRAGILAALALVLAQGAAAAQAPQAQGQPDERVVVEARTEATERREEAQRSAADARRLFAQTGKSGANLPAACRAAQQADNDFQIAIKAAQDQLNVSSPENRPRVEASIKGLMEARENLDETHDRLCRAGNQPRLPPAARGIPRPGRGERP
jgi:hypothetical protein